MHTDPVVGLKHKSPFMKNMTITDLFFKYKAELTVTCRGVLVVLVRVFVGYSPMRNDRGSG